MILLIWTGVGMATMAVAFLVGLLLGNPIAVMGGALVTFLGGALASVINRPPGW